LSAPSSAKNILPENINHMKIKFYLGSFYVFANPSALISAPLASAAAVHTFRSTVRRYTVKRDEPKPPSHATPE